MFILRTLHEDHTQTNYTLGDRYNMIDRDSNYDQFSDIFKQVIGIDHVADLDETSNQKTKLCYCFVGIAPNYIPLWKNNKNFIMTDSGKTFANISYK